MMNLQVGLKTEAVGPVQEKYKDTKTGPEKLLVLPQFAALRRGRAPRYHLIDTRP
jgi:hypothetical protein